VGPKTDLKVNADNFARAESHRMFADLQRDAGGVNRFLHNREPASVDQTVIRLNRDTHYSFAVVEVSDGATLAIPDAGGRYLSVMVVNEDHYIERVLHDPGEHRLTSEELGSEHVCVAVRTLVDPRDAEDLASVAAVQDRLCLEAASGRAFESAAYDVPSLDRTRQALLTLASDLTSFARSFGRPGDVDPVHHLIATAAGWGGLPDAEASYVAVSPGLPVGEYQLHVGPDVPVDAFWSVSVYNEQGYFEPNEHRAYSVNSVTAARDGDGSVTIRFGGDVEPALNSLPITEGWNYLIRLYRPRREILSGEWKFPTIAQ
jgi:hypothetical protein